MRTLRIGMLMALVVVVASGSGLGILPTPQAPADRKAPMHLFVLAGQSNMAGRGVTSDDDRSVHPRVWMLNREGGWIPAVEPMHFDKPIAGVGPGLAFGRALADADPAAQIGLVPTAVGGSPISAWEPGVLYEQTGAHPWDDALRRLTSATAGGEVKAVLWHQGESDANSQAAPLYEARLRSLIARFRAEAGNPSLPFIIGQLGRFEGRPWDASFIAVDAAHRRVAEDVPFVAFVSSAGLTDNGDHLHFSAESARELGRRYADAYLGLIRR